MYIGELPFNKKYANMLKGVAWKDLNVKNKNDFEKTIKEIDVVLKKRGFNIKLFHKYIDEVEKEIKNKELSFLGKKKFPPKGY